MRYTAVRDDGETTFEATIRWHGHYHRATHLDPAEYPEPEIDEAWRVSGDGHRVKLRPENLPEDVTEEILRDAVNGYGRNDEPEPPEDRCGPGCAEFGKPYHDPESPHRRMR